MKEFSKPILFNLVIIGIAFLLGLTTNSGDIIGRFAVSGFIIVLLGIANLIIGGVKLVGGKENGDLYLLSGGVILLIGFSVCTRLS